MPMYNTGNPVGSTAPKDLYDNAQVLDKLVVGSDPMVVDRLGNQRYSWAGMEYDFQNAQEGRDAAFQQFLADSAYVFIGDYGPGLTFTNRSQYTIRDGVPYRLAPATTVPYTSTGNWALEQSNFTPINSDDILRQDFSDPQNNIDAWQRRALSSVISSANKMLDAQSINIWEYANLVTNKPTANDPSTWDWTPAINAACVGQSDLFPTVGDIHVVFPQGLYRVTSATIGRRVHLYCAGAVFTPFNSGDTASHLLRFVGFNVTHDITIQMQFSVTYDTAMWVRGRYCDFYGTNIWACKCGWTIGDPAWETDPALGALGDSEININGGATVWAATSMRAFGQNTIVHVGGGMRVYSSKSSIPADHPNKAAWDALPANAVINCGALIYFVGCGMANFSGTDALILSKLQIVDEVANPAYKQSFGQTCIHGCHMETGFILQCAPVPSGYTANRTNSRVLEMSGVNGYLTSNASNTIALGANCLQGVHISGCGFYGVTNNNLINSGAANVPIYIEPGSFSNRTIDFFQTLRIQGPTGYENFLAANVTSTAQAFTTSLTPLIMPTRDVSDVFSSSESLWYNVSTGIFSPRSGMRNVKFDVSLVMSSGAAADVTQVQLLVAGSQVDMATEYGANPRVILRASRIARGATVEIRVSSSASRTASGSASNRLTITGSV